jgi:hypothetical protein
MKRRIGGAAPPLVAGVRGVLRDPWAEAGSGGVGISHDVRDLSRESGKACGERVNCESMARGWEETFRRAAMIRCTILVTVLFGCVAGGLPAEELNYRIIFRNTSGQISLPDEVGRNKKTYFIDLKAVGKKPDQMFGGSGDRFRVVAYRDVEKPETLTIEEVVTKRRIDLEVGVEMNLAGRPQGSP